MKRLYLIVFCYDYLKIRKSWVCVKLRPQVLQRSGVRNRKQARRLMNEVNKGLRLDETPGLSYAGTPALNVGRKVSVRGFLSQRIRTRALRYHHLK